MDWEKFFLKAVGFWTAVLLVSIIFLYVDKPFWAIVLWLAQMSYQLMALTMTVLMKRRDQGL